MGWNHRVLAFDGPEVKEVYFQVVEMYYNADNIPDGYALDKSVGGASIKEINWSLTKMKQALKKPIISKTNFPEEYKTK